ncbi:Uncharacterised protein [Slackia heliotrinireducens]|uniref:C2H2-type domain-containing protein n=1 Tax=Slackia heliotrinireducens (strain ATCC 29202 / DSM 20476 / NCTC 11029 / RHS 1) TaxID=471855 RepID=C7N6A0_SLAHD|nr:hypothetical protein [Slackia heliotrinireducens]ACV22435.1 hypothetical protein Shel_14140 [Slackia heliotrinireducens DSM 20476]VEH00783.1 Uncharacterised protein [Slackia heliotrinireducens]
MEESKTQNNELPEFNDYVEPEEVLLRRVANIYNDFKPVLWKTGKVELLRDDDGNVIGFYHFWKPWAHGIDVKSYRDSLPPEIFNHQLKELDVDDPEAVAEFMTEYGMIFDSWAGNISEMAQYNRFVNVESYGRPSVESIDAMARIEGSWITPRAWYTENRYNTKMLWEAEYKRMRACAESDDWSSFEPKQFLVSYGEVKENIGLVFEMVKLAKAASQYEEEDPLAEALGIDRSGLFDEILYLDEMLNGLLHVYHPKVGFQYILDGVPGNPTYHCDLFDIHDSEGAMSASFMNAVALQIRDFNIHLSDAHQCAECGEIFIVKQTARATKRAHSDSKFCCDKCKNKNTQRRHRESAGYKQKQAKKKASMKKPSKDDATPAQ